MFEKSNVNSPEGWKFALQAFSPINFLIIGLFVSCVGYAGADDIKVLKKNYTEFLLDSKIDDTKIRDYLETLKPDGAWPDIDYATRDRLHWTPGRHYRQLKEMALAYRSSDSKYQGNPELKAGILKALDFVLEKDPISDNWFSNEIGVPHSILIILILMDGEVPDAMIKRAMNGALKRARIARTGQNKVWGAGNVFLRSLLTKDEAQMKEAGDAILGEIRVTTEGGIQPDWSYHLHGPQLQIGNYGLNFGDDITQWALVFRGTPYGIDEQKMSIFRNYMLQGPGWITWKGKFDLSACGRQLGKGCQGGKGRRYLNQMKRMLSIDSSHSEAYKKIIDNNRADTNTFIGNKHFWRSDLMVHRRPEWYASVRMNSRRVIGAECVNSENMNGLHLSDGVLYVYCTGREYENILPFWDWHRLPGTTCDQSIKNLTPAGASRRDKDKIKKMMNQADFVGGVTDGSQGIAVLDYNREKVSAHKAWFFLDNAIVCLGSGINGKNSGQVLTSIEQSLLEGPVMTSSGTAKKESTMLQSGDWIQHAGIGYLLLNGDKPTLQMAEQTGNWRKVIGRSKYGEPMSKHVFSLWFDHGKSPKNQTYAYAVFPKTSADDMPAKVKNPGFTILSNTAELQAVETDNAVYAVFYTPGTLTWGKGHTLKVNKPCPVLIGNDNSFVIAEPTQKEKALRITVNGKTHTVDFPSGGFAGTSINLKQ